MHCFRQTLKAFNRIIAGKRKLVIFTRTVYIIDTRDLCDDQTGTSLCPLFIKTDKCICGFSARRPDPDTHCSHDKAVLCFNASNLPFFRDLRVFHLFTPPIRPSRSNLAVSSFGTAWAGSASATFTSAFISRSFWLQAPPMFSKTGSPPHASSALE